MEKTSSTTASTSTGTTERGTFTLNGKLFYSDSLPSEAKGLIQNINIIEDKIQDFILQADIAKIAKDSLIKKLEDMQDQFEAIPTETTGSSEKDK